MNEQTRFSDGTAPIQQAPVLSRGEGDETNFRELFDAIASGKWLIMIVLAVCLLIALIYALTFRPIYEATGLVQVEEEKNALKGTVDQLSSLIGAAPTQAPSEIAILKSRMVLGTVVDSLKLYISAEPKYFPMFGEAIARRRPNIELAAPQWGFLRGYAWGGESIQITSLEVPPSFYNKTFTLVANGRGYDLLDSEGNKFLSGTVGERATVATAAGPFAIFVQELAARPGTNFMVTRLALQTALADLGGRFSVMESPHDSGVLNLSLTANDPATAARLINEIEDAYLRQNVDRRSAQAEQSLEFLKRQLPELKGKVDEAQAQLNSYQSKKGSIDVQQETQLVLQQAVGLETQRQELVQERDAALERYTAQHPVVTSLNEQIRGIEREQASFKKQIEALPETQQEILSLMRDLEVNTELYTSLLNSSQELQVTKAGTVGNVRIIDYALPPLFPIKPQKRAIFTLGGLIGLMLGLISVFASRALLRGVDRPEEVERALGIATYASIPFSRHQRTIGGKLRRGAADGSILAVVDPNDVAIEALRSLRTSLHFAMLESTNNVVMLTGPAASLGKSFVSMNLGAVLALSGKRVVVVDADMRRGHLHRYLESETSKLGLSDYIASTVDEASIVRKTPVDGLDLIPSGTRPPNPSEILMSERFDDLLKTLSKRYDYVLIDTPPIIPVTDAAIIGRLAGTTLIVLKSAEHPMRIIEESVKRLRQAGVQVQGTIFNQVGARMGSYGYGEYGEAYGYNAKNYQSTKPQ